MGPIIIRVLAGTGSAEDEAELRRWLDGGPERARQLDELRTIWRESATLQQGWDTTALQQRILAGVDSKVVPIRARAERRFRVESRTGLVAGRRRSWLPVAVAAVLVIAVGALVWQLSADRRRSAVQEPALTELATRRGQRAALRLSDGTRITLGVDSRLRYPEAFATGASRDVYLEGEAFFEVARDTSRPFRVHAGDAVTRVLGTRFGVRAYPEDDVVRVVVAEGKVALGRDTAAVVELTRGDLGELPAAGAPVVQRGVDLSTHLAWVEGRLVFADTPLDEVARRLSRWYDIDVRLGDRALADDPYTMSLRGDESPERVLRVMAAAVGARLERRGTAYVILSPTPTEAR